MTLDLKKKLTRLGAPGARGSEAPAPAPPGDDA
jgi:hypothetical protein